MNENRLERIKEYAAVSAIFDHLIHALEDILKENEIKDKLTGVGQKIALTDLFFREFVDDDTLMLRGITDPDMKKRMERYKNEFGGIMLRWILNDKDTCFGAIVKMVTEAKKLAAMIESDNVGRELNIPAEEVNTTKEMREMMNNDMYRDIHKNDIRRAMLDFICISLPTFKEMAAEEGKPLADVMLDSINDTCGKIGFKSIDSDEDFYRNIIEQVKDLPEEEANKKIKNISIGLEKKNGVRTLEDAFNVAGIAALLISIAKDEKGLITNNETFKGVTSLAIRRQIGKLPKDVILKLTKFCSDYYDNFTEEGKQKFIDNVDKYVREISKEKDLMKNTFLDSIASGKGAMVIDETGDISDITNKILDSLDEDDDEDEDDEEE